jgi:hypothetical protein
MNTQNSLFDTQYLYKFWDENSRKYFDVICIFKESNVHYFVFDVVITNSQWKPDVFQISKKNLKDYRYIKIGKISDYPEYFI